MLVAFVRSSSLFFFFFFNDTATTEIYTLSLHDALPISGSSRTAGGTCARSPGAAPPRVCARSPWRPGWTRTAGSASRSEEHTSELQSPCNLVCRLLLEKKKKSTYNKRRVTG